MAQSIDQSLARIFGGPTLDDKLAEISRDLAQLHDRLARVLGTEVGFWTPRLPVEVSRPLFDRLPGSISFHRTNTPFDTKYPYKGIVLYCYDVAPTPAPEPIDHDLTAENAPDEWAASTPGPRGVRYHDFWTFLDGWVGYPERTIYHWPDGSVTGVTRNGE